MTVRISSGMLIYWGREVGARERVKDMGMGGGGDREETERKRKRKGGERERERERVEEKGEIQRQDKGSGEKRGERGKKLSLIHI